MVKGCKAKDEGTYTCKCLEKSTNGELFVERKCYLLLRTHLTHLPLFSGYNIYLAPFHHFFIVLHKILTSRFLLLTCPGKVRGLY